MLVLDTVSTIFQPAMFSPVTTKQLDYILLQDKKARKDLVFMYIPYEYLFRNDWGSTAVNIFDDLKRNIHNSASTTAYLTANLSDRKKLQKKLKNTLKRNVLKVQQISDYDLVQSAIERAR